MKTIADITYFIVQIFTPKTNLRAGDKDREKFSTNPQTPGETTIEFLLIIYCFLIP